MSEKPWWVEWPDPIETVDKNGKVRVLILRDAAERERRIQKATKAWKIWKLWDLFLTWRLR